MHSFMKSIVRHPSTIVSQLKHQLCKLLSNTPQPRHLPLEMAEAVLFSLATNILNSLAAEVAKPGGSFASQKIQLLCGAKDELQSLERTIQSIQAVLLDAEKQQWHNHQVKLWLKRLKDVLYDIQDLFDDVATEDLRRKVASGNKTWKEVRLFFSKSNQLAHRLKVSNKIQELRKKLDWITKDRVLLNLEPRQNEETCPIVRRRTPAIEREEDIIGREEDKEAIIAHLLDSSSRESVSVVSIIGIGGLGKTTLADLVYKDEKVKDCFELKMWVCHGDPEIFDVDLIIKEILKSAKDECQGDPEMRRNLEGIENKNGEQLRRLLGKVLEGKKYLLVLDDLWNDDRHRWLELRPLLMGGSRGSKILVTTRNQSVVHATDAKSVIHDLHGLSEDKSWELFQKMAFGDGEEFLCSRLEEIGRDIVKKCAGVPLAIRTIGSLLYAKKEKEWLNFKERELSEIDKSDHGIIKVLKLSYDHLPSNLKHCFAYCVLFPKDYVFDKQTMIQLWMAQGFIESLEGSEALEETGDSYVSDLLCRSFLKVEAVDDYTGEVETFKMHDLMHDLALNVAGDECKMIDLNEGGINGGIRHASFASQLTSLKEVTSLFEATNLRTFLSLKNWTTSKLNFSPNEDREILSKFRRCRTLGLSSVEVCIPRSLGSKLKHLRFIDLSRNQSIQSLPDSITDLVNLQTLKLSRCEGLTTLPRDLKKLVNLRHLLIDGCNSLSHMPHGLNHLSSLRTLSHFIVQKVNHKVPGGVGSLDELGGLNRLGGSIILRNLEFLKPASKKFHLKEKQRLRSLKLMWSEGQQEDDKSERDESILWYNLWPHPNLTNLTIDSCMSRSPPGWLSSIKNVVELELEECGRWKYLPPLGELSSLRRLILVRLNALEFVQEISDQEQFNTQRPFFPSLEALNLDDCPNLKGWWGRRQRVGADQDHWQYDSHSTFPKLSVVTIWDCHRLNSLPLFPQVKTFIFWGGVMAVPKYQSEAAVSPSTPLSKLEHLDFVDVVDLEDPMLETLLPLLGNLRSMRLWRCPKLRSLSRGMQYLSSLSSLEIDQCEELDLSSHDDEHGTQWRSLAKLRDLSISQLSKLAALPEGIQHVITLQSLEIISCENLTSLPEWIGNFSSLQELDVRGCSALTCLPDGMRRLTSLKILRIANCPVLQERCRRESGADWEKIAHLPEVRVHHY